MSRRLLLPAWCVALLGMLVVLHLLGGGDLAVPADPRGWHGHVDRVGPATTIAGVLRLVALALAWYLVIVTAFGAVGRSAGSQRAVVAADAVTPRFLRRLLGSAGSLALTGAGLAAVAAPIAVGVDTAVSVSASPGSAGSTVGLIQVPPLDAEPTADAEPTGGADPADGVDAAVATSDDPSTAEFAVLDLSGLGEALAAATAVALPPSVDETWEVSCGDHLWSIAEEVLSEATGSAIDDERVTDYWLTLIDANRDRLVAPDNPDLLLPGQVLMIPPPPSEG